MEDVGDQRQIRQSLINVCEYTVLPQARNPPGKRGWWQQHMFIRAVANDLRPAGGGGGDLLAQGSEQQEHAAFRGQG